MTDTHTCAECAYVRKLCCDHGICNFDISVDFARSNCDSKLPVEVMFWTLNWVADNLRDMQDAACDDFCNRKELEK